jgi:predicted acyltransferase
LPETETPPQRLISLDVLRGLAAMGMILVNSTALLRGVYEVDVLPWLLHTPWAGLQLADLVFPAFLLMAGISIPLAFRRARSSTGWNREQARHIAGRTLRLIVLGLILTNLNWLADTTSASWRLWDVLQRIGLVYGACAVLFFFCQPRTLAGLAAALLLLYWPLALLPPLDGLPGDIWQRGHNFVASVDRVMLGAGGHLWVAGPAGYEPEGLLGTLPAIAHGLIGVLVGEYLLQRRGRKGAWRLAGAGAAMLAVGSVWGLAFPVIKDLWSSSFVLVTSGITTLLLAGLHALLDHGGASARGRSFLTNVPLAFGLNAIAAYVLQEVAAPLLGWELLFAPFSWAVPLVGEPVAALIQPLLFLFFIWLCMDYLRRRNWIIHI